MGELPSGTYRVDAAVIVVSQPTISDANLPVKIAGDRLQLGTRIVTRAPKTFRPVARKQSKVEILTGRVYLSPH
jgi:hypothetical protein